MNNLEVEKIIRLTRSRAKFVHVSHSDEFIEEKNQEVKKFHYVNLYDEKIDSNVLKVGSNFIIVHNTYLSSFAYNLGLCWLYSLHKLNTGIDLNNNFAKNLLKHNYKKLFAEQLFYFRNTIFSRSILLETLLYEQEIMVDVFTERTANESLDKSATFLSNLFSSLLSNHELAHIYLDSEGVFWQEYISKQDQDVIAFFEEIKNKYPKSFEEELACDIIAVLNCIEQYHIDFDKGFLLNSIIWGFSSYATIYSLVKSAKYTINQQKAIEETVDFKSITSNKMDYDYFIGEDKDFIERARIMIELCTRIGMREGIDLFQHQKDFPIPQSILRDSIGYLDEVMINNDENARKMSMLVAESLFNHDSGSEYLYLRSKTFSSNRGKLSL